MKDIVVLLTCCGGLVSPSQIQSLRCIRERRIKIIGVDMDENAIGSFLVDKFFKIPSGEDPNYTNIILDISKKEKVDVILPCSHEEALTLAKDYKAFASENIVIAISDFETLRLAFDKGEMYNFLKTKNLPCPKFRIVHSPLEFIAAATAMGYPDFPVVIKPRLSRGGRGARILTNQSLKYHLLNEKPGSLFANFDEILKTLSEGNEFPEVILMEYLPGEYYSVDLLVQDGRVLVSVPKIRLKGTPSQTLIGVVDRNPEVERIAEEICQAFKFSFNVNIEMKYSQASIPLPYDINPRPAASVAFCTAAGANLLYFSVKMALGETIPRPKIKNGIKMIRSFRELFIDGKKYFFIDEISSGH